MEKSADDQALVSQANDFSTGMPDVANGSSTAGHGEVLRDGDAPLEGDER